MRRTKMLFLTSCLVWLVALAVAVPVEARDSSAYRKNGAAAQQGEGSAQQKAATGLKYVTSSNLVIYAPGLWTVLRYDAQSRSLTVTSSDLIPIPPPPAEPGQYIKDAALWYDETPTVVGNTITATCTLISGAPEAEWANFVFYDIVIRGGTAYIYETTSLEPNITILYKGRAVRITTF